MFQVSLLVLLCFTLCNADEGSLRDRISQNLQEQVFSWPSLFSGEQQSTFNGIPITQGEIGCLQGGGMSSNLNWQTYLTTSSNSMTIKSQTGECRTVNSFDKCQFKVGDGGVTTISFDYNIDSSCYGGGVWFSFWMFSLPWSQTVEVDFIESQFPYNQCLNINFAGHVPGVQITSKFQGSVKTTFSGSGGAIQTSVTANGVNTLSSTLSSAGPYFFVFDTATGGNAASDQSCAITISNLQVVGTNSCGF